MPEFPPGSSQPPRSSTQPTPLARLRDYELLSRLGQGGMGTVYLARHVHLEKLMAIKLLPRQHTSNPEMVARFRREMKAVGKLQHPNLIQAHDAGELRGVHYLVLEYAEGLDVGTLVQQSGPLPIADACEIIRQAALGLDHAHRHGLVHRDIKPSNLMVCRMDALVRPSLPRGTSQATSERSDEGVQPTVKILDLGLALLNAGHETANKDLTGSQQIMGTLDYMAPEQTVNTHAVDIRADIYSLGCTLYALLSGRAPFADQSQPWQKLAAHNNTPPKPIRKVRADVPEPVAAILQRMLAKRPEQRYQTPRELAAAIEPHCRHNTLVATLVNAEARQAEHQARANAATRSLHQSALQGTTGAGASDAPRGSHDPVEIDEELLDLIRAASQSDLPTPSAPRAIEATQILVHLDTQPVPRALSRRLRQDSRRWWWQAVGIAGITLLGVAIMAVVLWIQTNAGTIKLTLYHPDAQVTLDGSTIRLRAGDEDDEYLIRVSPGQHKLEIEKDGYTTFTREIEIAKGEQKLVGVQLLRLDAEPIVGWTPSSVPGLPRSEISNALSSNPERTDEGVHPTNEEYEREVAEWVLSIGGSLTVVKDGQQIKLTPGSKLPDSPFAAYLIDLKSQPTLRDEDLKRLARLTQLQELFIISTPITDRGVEYLSKLTSLKTIQLDNTKVTDASVDSLLRLSNLEFLLVGNTNVSPAALRKLKLAPRLKHLAIWSWPFDSMVASDLRELPTLRELELHESWITEDGVTELAKLQLTGVTIRGSISDERLSFLRRLPKLSDLSFMGDPNVSPDGLETLREFPTLTKFMSASFPLSDQHLESLAKCDRLERIQFVNYGLSTLQITDEGLKHLERLPKLKMLDLYKTSVTPAGLAHFRAAKPACVIQTDVPSQ